VTSSHARELLESVHDFPGPFTIKAIGLERDGFVDRILRTAQTSLTRPGDVQHSTRLTPNGRHVAVTLVIVALNSAEVVAVYESLRVVEGLKFLM
jgi:hypothetical protein